MKFSQTLLIQVISRVSLLLNKRQLKGGGVVLAGIIVNGVLDVLGLATILPVISIALDDTLITEQPTLARMYEWTGVESHDHFLMLLIGFLFLTFLVKNLFGLLINYQQVNYSYSVARSIARRMFILYFNNGYQFIKTIDSGKFITDIKNVPSFFAQGILMTTLTLISEMLVVSVIIIGLAIVDLRMIVGLGLILGFSFILIYRSVRRQVFGLGQERKVVAPETVSRINETILGYIDVTIFKRVPHFLKKFLKPMNREYHLSQMQAFYNMIPPRGNEVIAILGISLVFIYGILLSDSREELFFLLTLMATAAYRMMPSMNRMLQAMLTMKSNLYTLDILGQLVEGDDELREGIKPLPMESGFEVRELSFHFDDDETWVLEDVSFEVKKGETIGFIGESGSGKSTLLKVLLRLLAQQKGDIVADGKVLTPEQEESWQRNIGYVQQDIFIIEGTLLENIAFGEPVESVNRDQVHNALRQAGLEGFVETLPEGIDTYLGEFGSRLSGGQKQRLAIARALYQEVEIFMFDEATSALDPETERVVTESIRQLSKANKTVLLVAHRLTTLEGCDRIYEMSKGRIQHTYNYEQMIKEKLGLVKDTSL